MTHSTRYLEPDPSLLVSRKDQEGDIGSPRLHALNQAIVQLVSTFAQVCHRTHAHSISKIEDHPLVSFLPLDLTDPDSIEYVISHIDFVMQYGEDEEPKEVCSLWLKFRGRY